MSRWAKGFEKEVRSLLRGVKPRKVYLKKKVKNYHIGGLSITINDFFGYISIYDLKNHEVLGPGDEDRIIKVIKKHVKRR